MAFEDFFMSVFFFFLNENTQKDLIVLLIGCYFTQTLKTTLMTGMDRKGRCKTETLSPLLAFYFSSVSPGSKL